MLIASCLDPGRKCPDLVIRAVGEIGTPSLSTLDPEILCSS
ncbi:MULTISPECIES: hypothetical protein [unclassified Moorena]|nr:MULTISPECIES: hypothetical protein [unclassified Moorena]